MTDQEETYTGRIEEEIVVKHYTPGDLLTMNSWGWSPPQVPGMERIVQGDTLIAERQGMRMTGLKFPGEDWLYHDSDQKLEEQHQEWLKGWEQDKIDRLNEHREEWTAREALLPEDLQERLAYFRANGAEEFEKDGWGYELNVCELVVLYREADVDEDKHLIDSEAVNEYARAHGTSGNQHEVAKLIVYASAELTPIQVPAALRPLGATYDRPPVA